jgi:pilus assembly protein CpaC
MSTLDFNQAIAGTHRSEPLTSRIPPRRWAAVISAVMFAGLAAHEVSERWNSASPAQASAVDVVPNYTAALDPIYHGNFAGEPTTITPTSQPSLRITTDQPSQSVTLTASDLPPLDAGSFVVTSSMSGTPAAAAVPTTQASTSVVINPPAGATETVVIGTQPAPTPAGNATNQPVALAVVDQPATAPSPADQAFGDVVTPRLVEEGVNSDGRVLLQTGKNSMIKTGVPISRLSIGSQEVATVNAVNSDTILVNAKKAGTTQIIVWDDKERSQIIDVIVTLDLTGLTDHIKKIAGESKIDVIEVNGAVSLRGIVPDAEVAKQIEQVASQYGKVLNQLEVAGGQTVVVQVQFAEVSRSATNSLGVNWGFESGVAAFGMNIGQIAPLGLNAQDGVISGLFAPTEAGAASVFGKGQVGNNPFAYYIQALRENNLMRMLANPYITTSSGAEGRINAGGEFPVPVPSAQGGSPTIDYRKFGIELKCTPVVLGNGKIRMKVDYEVSDLDYGSAVNVLGVSVPGLRTRNGTTTVELAEGQTLPLGGLFDSRTISNVSKFPGLGDIPYIGQLFRSTRFQRRETELVILLTPNLAGALNPGEVPTLPGAGWRNPTDWDQFAYGDGGGDAQADPLRDWNKDPADRGAPSNVKGKPRGYAGLGGSTEVNPPVALQPGVRPVADTAPPVFMGTAGYAPVQDGSTSATDAAPASATTSDNR